MNAHAWRAQVAYWVRRMGVPGGLGALMMLGVAGLLLLEALPAAERVASLGARKAALQQRVQQTPGQGGAALTPSQQLQAFNEGFPPGAQIADVLARVHEIAEEQHLALDLGEYAVVKTPGARLDQLRITLPVKGGYVPLRQFAQQALLEHPSLALESLSVRRDKVTEEMLDGRIVFLLFVEHGA